jgi:DNA topoisomerase-1
MAKHLVIVESPAKSKTVGGYLGSDFIVKASMGHVCDLPKKEMGVDVEKDFAPKYEIIPERKALINDLQKTAAKCADVLLAADPDREGEAICWHLKMLLEDHNKNIGRVLFHEITKNAVGEAFSRTGGLDHNKYNAQQTRRILDRLVGYSISPLLWKKLGLGRRLSAGRVQSIALRLICEREKEIKDFKKEEYWTIMAQLRAANPPDFSAGLTKISGKKAKIDKESQAKEIVADLEKCSFFIDGISVKDKIKNPGPPYITSTLQQEGYKIFNFPVKKTMSVAQKLYEGMEIGERGLIGLITYMRTDSLRVSDEALRSSREYILKNYSGEYLPPRPRIFKNRRKAQDAHEAIRPTSLDLPPEKVKDYLDRDAFKIYSLIWNRFIASQMSAARVEETEFEIKASKYLFKAKGEVIKFDGYLVLYPNLKKNDKILPKAKKGEELDLLGLESKQNFTQPPPRYTEGSLVKELEARGIGRPSTYAPIIATLQGREYVFKEKGKFIPTEIGFFVTDFLVKNFPDLMEYEFTAKLEEELDKISEGEENWVEYMKSYYQLLVDDLKEAYKEEGMRGIPSEDVCPECGRNLVIKSGRYGKFKACSGYPECTYKTGLNKKEPVTLEETCPECGAQLVERSGRYGRFVACSRYPDCKYVKKETKDLGIICPECGEGTILKKKTRKGKVFYGCSKYPKCKFATWDEPIQESCPQCGKDFLLKKSPVKGSPYIYCIEKECGYEQNLDADPENAEEPIQKDR